MAETYKGFNLNTQGDAAPWAAKETTVLKDVIDLLATKGVPLTDSHHHYQLYNSGDTAVALSSDGYGDIEIYGTPARDSYLYLDKYSATVEHSNRIAFRKSHSDTAALVETIDADVLGTVEFYGVQPGGGTPAWYKAASIRCEQVGAAGVSNLQSNMIFTLGDSTHAIEDSMVMRKSVNQLYVDLITGGPTSFPSIFTRYLTTGATDRYSWDLGVDWAAASSVFELWARKTDEGPYDPGYNYLRFIMRNSDGVSTWVTNGSGNMSFNHTADASTGYDHLVFNMYVENAITISERSLLYGVNFTIDPYSSGTVTLSCLATLDTDFIGSVTVDTDTYETIIMRKANGDLRYMRIWPASV